MNPARLPVHAEHWHAGVRFQRRLTPSVVMRTFALAVLAGVVAIALLGVGEWGLFLHRLGGQELGQVLTTMGIALIFQDLGLVLWGGEPYTIPTPAVLSGAYQLGQLYFPVYRLFIIKESGRAWRKTTAQYRTGVRTPGHGTAISFLLSLDAADPGGDLCYAGHELWSPIIGRTADEAVDT